VDGVSRRADWLAQQSASESPLGSFAACARCGPWCGHPSSGRMRFDCELLQNQLPRPHPTRTGSWGLHDPFGHRNARLGGRAPGQGLRAACGCLDRAAALINTLFERLYSNSAGTHFSYCPMQGENSSMRPPAGRPPCAPAHRARRQIESQDAAPPAGCADGGSCGRT
jgi:hypothetical protein